MTTQPKPKKRNYIIGGIVAVMGLTTVLGAQAYSNSRIAAHINVERAYSGDHGKVWKTGWRRGGHGFSEMSAEDREKHIVRMVKHLAIEVDATDAQQTQLVGVIKDFTGEILPLKEAMKADREEVIKLLTAATIDRDALETLRTKKLADAEEISKKLVDAVADAAEILTAEQRKTVADRIDTLGKMRGWRH